MTKDEIDKLENEITSLRTEYAILNDKFNACRNNRERRDLKKDLYDLRVCITEKVKKTHKEEKKRCESVLLQTQAQDTTGNIATTATNDQNT